MAVIGGFIHKVGLVVLGGASQLEVDAETTYFQPLQTHASNHPVSSGWFHPVFGRDNASATDSDGITRTRAMVSGALIGMGVDVSVNTRSDIHSIYFRINGISNLTLTVPASTTGSFIDDTLDIPFEEGDFFNIYQAGIGTGTLDFKFSSIIKWN